MNTEELLQHAETLLKPWIKEMSRPEENRLDVIIDPEDLPAATDALIVKSKLGYLAAITGLDDPQGNQIEVVYTYSEQAAVVNLRVKVPYSNSVVPTLCDVVPSATLYERELIEMFGVEVRGTPNTERLLLPDNWPDGVFPMRKSFEGLSETTAN